MAPVEAPSGVQSYLEIRSVPDLLRSEFGCVRVKGGKLRSKGEVSEARVATVTSEVAHPGGEKAA